MNLSPYDSEDFPEIRAGVRRLCAEFPGEYWRRLDEKREYPTAFVKALTDAGYLSVLIPEEYGGSGLGLTAAAAILSLAALLYTGLVAFPWPAALALAVWAAWRAGGLRLALFTGLSLAFVLATGLWVPFVKSLYLVIVAVALCALAGGFLGVLAARSDHFSAVLRPINDALQTMPQFVFLIPALMFFKVGEFAGLIAIALYAVVPAIRYTETGLRNVSPTLLETTRQLGCTSLQSTLLVQLPTARPALLLGLNQVVMAAITMLPIAATVGTAELGQQIYIALGKADAGLGITAGLVFCLLAINLDRILRGVAARLHGAP